MNDWQEITSPPFTGADGSLFEGELLLRLPAATRLASGQLLSPGVTRFTVTAGIAAGTGAGGFPMLPITEDANPPLSLGLSLLTAAGLVTYLGEVIVPRPDDVTPHPAIPLVTLLPLGTL